MSTYVPVDRFQLEHFQKRYLVYFYADLLLFILRDKQKWLNIDR